MQGATQLFDSLFSRVDTQTLNLSVINFLSNNVAQLS
jgi:hypothetical protein